MVLVDTSIWIDYFKGKESARLLNELIDDNEICVNELILSELIPSIEHRGEPGLKDMLFSITDVPLSVDWHAIRAMQLKNLKNGINNVGIPDLIIALNVIDNGIVLFSSDKHVSLMSQIHGFKLYGQ